MSYVNVVSQMGSGGQLEGWRYATRSDFNLLVGNYTGTPIPPTWHYPTYQEVDKIDGLVALLGSTLDTAWIANTGVTYDQYNQKAEGEYEDHTVGMLAEGNSQFQLLAGLFDLDASVNDSDYSITDWRLLWQYGASYYVGSFLVRNSVPEPSSIALIGLGLIGLASYRCKNSQQHSS